MTDSIQDNEKTVSFNVGERLFDVRHSLLDAFPKSILARSASEEWQAVDGTERSIFFDRDGDRFRYCLDYMRDGMGSRSRLLQ